jgi:plasmid stabilization system protein ParE
MQVRWTTLAAQDLHHVTNRIRRDNPMAARRVAKTLYDGAMSLRRIGCSNILNFAIRSVA